MKLTLAVMNMITGIVLSGTPAFAHHSLDATYALSERATVEGDVIQFLYRNPHSFLHVERKDPSTGELIRWAVEFEGARRLGREGLARETLKPGDHLVVIGQPGKKPADHRLNAVSITRPSDNWEWHRGARR